jgi:nitrous oxidase accessory protein NosD
MAFSISGCDDDASSSLHSIYERRRRQEVSYCIHIMFIASSDLQEQILRKESYKSIVDDEVSS